MTTRKIFLIGWTIYVLGDLVLWFNTPSNLLNIPDILGMIGLTVGTLLIIYGITRRRLLEYNNIAERDN